MFKKYTKKLEKSNNGSEPFRLKNQSIRNHRRKNNATMSSYESKMIKICFGPSISGQHDQLRFLSVITKNYYSADEGL